MSDFINSCDRKKTTKLGMLFLFDVVGSSERASKSENLANKIFYQKVEIIVKSVVDELNQTYRYGVQLAQNTGDGCYIFSKEPECCLQLWILLCRQFANEQITVRCGAAYGRVNINEINIGSHLANVVARCCNFPSNEDSLIITSDLYNLIMDCSLFHTLAPRVNRIEKPKLKGCANIEAIFQLGIAGVKRKNPNNNNCNLDSQNTFVGRNETLQRCISIVEDCFFKNEVLNIIGNSGVGKTTIAICAAKLLHYNVVCVDLRQITNLRELHGLLINLLFDELEKENITKAVAYLGKQTLTAIFSTIKNIALIFDHAELFSEIKYQELISFLPDLNQLSTGIILTSTCSQNDNILYTREWLLANPSDDEKIEMLSYWIKTNRVWLKSLANQITNHSYLICLIGCQFKGSYKRKKDLACIEDYIVEAADVSNFLKKIINELPINIRFWIYLAYLCNGSVFSQAIPNSVLEKYNTCGLIKEIGESIVFHPLIMRAVEAEYSTIELEKIVYDHLCNITDEKCKTLIEYYKYLCLGDGNYKKKSEILVNNWQSWSEEIDSYKTQALIEKLKLSLGSNRQSVYYDLFSSIIHIFQGSKDDLIIASRKCEELYSNQNIPMVLRLLAKIESIECQRKLNGPIYSIELIYNDLDIINDMLSITISDDYVFYGKYYYIGTVFFLIGNILRSIEDHSNAIIAYNISLQYINKEVPDLRNAELQKVHIAYGIAESHLKDGQSCLAIELANESIRTVKTTAKFGVALLYLLKARAHLCSTFSNIQNYRDALTSVKKAEELFKSIRLPNYIQRCNFVEGAIYTKKGRLLAARKSLVVLNEHLMGTDELTYRVNILLNYVIGIKGTTSVSQVNAITKRKGKQIGIFYCKLSGIENDMSFSTVTNTISVQGNQLERGTFSISISDLDRNLWLVD